MIGIPRLPSRQGIRATLNIDDRFDRQPIFFGEREIPFIVRRHAHDGTVAVAHQHIVADPHGYGFAADGVAHMQARRHALFFLSGKLGFVRRSALAFFDKCSQLRIFLRGKVCQRMLGSHGAKSRAHDGVGARGEDPQHAAFADVVRKAETHAFTAADPIGLHDAHSLRPLLHALQFIEQILGVGRDLQVIHGNFAFFDDRAGAPTTAVDDLLVRQHRLVDRIPIDDAGLLIRDALFQHA